MQSWAPSMYFLYSELSPPPSLMALSWEGSPLLKVFGGGCMKGGGTMTGGRRRNCPSITFTCPSADPASIQPRLASKLAPPTTAASRRIVNMDVCPPDEPSSIPKNQIIKQVWCDCRTAGQAWQEEFPPAVTITAGAHT